mmetsp:Transcript_45422/g.86857  ORF Transcript_45422/g.86857 Transcript_45422/m.86857 type:complete len:269 (-) Transcript_45422:85-891(-)
MAALAALAEHLVALAVGGHRRVGRVAQELIREDDGAALAGVAAQVSELGVVQLALLALEGQVVRGERLRHGQRIRGPRAQHVSLHAQDAVLARPLILLRFPPSVVQKLPPVLKHLQHPVIGLPANHVVDALLQPRSPRARPVHVVQPGLHRRVRAAALGKRHRRARVGLVRHHARADVRPVGAEHLLLQSVAPEGIRLLLVHLLLDMVRGPHGPVLEHARDLVLATKVQNLPQAAVAARQVAPREEGVRQQLAPHDAHLLVAQRHTLF